MHRLTIHRWQVQYQVSSELPQPERVCQQVSESVQRQVSDWLRVLLIPVLPHDEHELVFIDRLQFEADVNASWERDKIAKRIAGQLVKKLQHQLSEPAPGIRRFRDSTEYVAQFLIDISSGVAWQCWWYQAFEGLRALPATSVVRTVLIDPDYHGRAALSSLVPATAKRVLAVVSESDAARISQAWVNHTMQSLASALQAVMQCWQLASWPGVEQISCRSLLQTYLNVAREVPSQGGASLFMALEIFNQLVWRLQRQTMTESSTDTMEIFRHIDALGLVLPYTRMVWSTDYANILQHINAHGVLRQHYGSLLKIDQHPGNWQVICEQLAAAYPDSSVVGTKSSAKPEQHETLFTPYGGIFLLLPLLECAVSASADSTQEADDDNNQFQQRAEWLWQLAACFGAEQQHHVFNDAVLRTLFELTPQTEAHALAATASFKTPAAVTDAYLGSMAFACPSVTSPQQLQTQLMLLDGHTGYWQRHAPMPVDDDDFAATLAEWLEHLPGQAELLVEDKFLQRLHCDAVSQQRTILAYPWLADSPQRSERLDERDAQRLDHERVILHLRIEQLAADWQFLVGEAEIAPPDVLRMMHANNLLRNLAQRLPGFAQSGLAHIVRNFLALPAALEIRQDNIRVTLGQAPLDLILSMTGMKRRSYTLPWLTQRTIQLVSGE